ncbi:hypothetical protein [Micromonospora sp. RTP1Z1]|uniref:hypothetical protein n=1 Tax=Micromonospora sp. RTP1Z1 TaxID=2994043 RepID=UPI0029C6F67D|nr:hypothetical protein [Micromonospora sp. RTP1Z1]
MMLAGARYVVRGSVVSAAGEPPASLEVLYAPDQLAVRTATLDGVPVARSFMVVVTQIQVPSGPKAFPIPSDPGLLPQQPPIETM